MKLKESTYDYMKRRAWENMDAFVHLEATGHKPWMYPHFICKKEYVIDPWMSDPDNNATICNPDKEYGCEKMDSLYMQILRADKDNQEIDLGFLNHPETPDGWIYIGDDKNVRYALGEIGQNNMMIVGLNPSKATPEKLDQTTLRVKEIAHREGYDGWVMVNLYPKRSTDPNGLPKQAKKELMDVNNGIIEWIAQKSNIGRVYAAWGKDIELRDFLINQGQRVVEAINSESWFTKGITKAGHPRHPSRVSYEEKMEWFPVQDYLWSFN